MPKVGGNNGATSNSTPTSSLTSPSTPSKEAPTIGGPSRSFKPVPRRKPVKAKFTNRGPAGLLRKIPGKGKDALEVDLANAPKDNIAQPISYLTVDIASLTPDPENARLHPERNMEAIKQSLALYGQVKPIVVREEGMIVIAGNGTLAAAKSLGWTKIAASIIPMTSIQAAGYGIADNRTSELAKWNEKVLIRIAKLTQEQNEVMVGWSSDELEVLRAAEDIWIPPLVEDESEEAHPDASMRVLKFTKDQAALLDRISEFVKKREAALNGKVYKWSTEECILYVLRDWLGEEPYLDPDNSNEEEEVES